MSILSNEEQGDVLSWGGLEYGEDMVLLLWKNVTGNQSRLTRRFLSSHFVSLSREIEHLELSEEFKKWVSFGLGIWEEKSGGQRILGWFWMHYY